jgi:WD40 repeat protein
MKGHTEDIATVVWSKDGSELVSAGFDTKLLLWDATQGKLVKKIGSHGIDNAVLMLRWHWDRNLLISGGSSHIMVWDTEEWQLLQKIEKSKGDDVAAAYSLDWSPDGNNFVSSWNVGIDVWSQEAKPGVEDNTLIQSLCLIIAVVIILVLILWVITYIRGSRADEEGGKKEEAEEE